MIGPVGLRDPHGRSLWTCDAARDYQDHPCSQTQYSTLKGERGWQVSVPEEMGHLSPQSFHRR